MVSTFWLMVILAAVPSITFCQTCRCPTCQKAALPDKCLFAQTFNSTSKPSAPYLGPLGRVTVGSPLTQGRDCERQAMFRVTPTAATQSISIYILVKDPKGWTFNVGDDDTNDGYGGDYKPNSQGWAAEIHNTNDRDIVAYENTVWRPGHGPPVPLNFLFDYFDDNPTVLEINITRGNWVQLTTNPYIKGTHVEFRNDHFFNFDEIYVGINRVIGGTSRTGTGACDLCIKFF